MQSSSKKRAKRVASHRTGLNASTTEAKLSRISIHYEYLFEWDVNFKERIITLPYDIDADEFSRLDAAMTEMESESRQAITIKISSFGGDEHAALAIVGRMRKSKCMIITEGYGAIMSAATLILAAGKRRRISELAWFMWHESSYALEGRHSENKVEVIQQERVEEQWAFWMQQFTKKPAKFWLEKGRLLNAYFDAEQLVKLGVADEIF